MKNKIMRNHFEDRYKGYTKEMVDFVNMPSSLNLELNSTCNYQCTFCAYHSPHSNLGHSFSVMDIKTAKQILTEAYELGIGRKELGLYISGEPFLYPHLVEVIKFAKNLGYKYIYLTSNGELAFPNKIYEAIEAGLDSVRFSVNEVDRKTYMEVHGRDAFEKVKEGIITLCKYRKEQGLKISISISCVITQKNRHITGKMNEIFGDYVDDIIFVPVIKSGCFSNTIDDIFFEEKEQCIDEKFICKALFDSMYINADAEVLVCCESCAMGRYVVAKWGDADLDEIWNMPLYREYRSLYLENRPLEGTICEKCAIRLTSGGPFFAIDDI